MAKTLNTAGPRRLCPVRQHSLHTPDLIAIRAPRQVLTYRQLDHQLNAVQQQLAASGLQPGDHLASIGANSLALILLAWGCLRAGLVFCPLNPRLPRVQLHAQLQQLDAKACWLATEWRAAADGEPDQAWPCPILALEWGLNPAEPNPEATANADAEISAWLDTQRLSNLILTSGSSGTPKAVAHSLAAHWASAEGSAQAIPLQPGDGWLLSLPLFHVGG